MKLVGRLEIKSQEKIKEFLNHEHVGRIASIDENGYPQIIPMNFAFVNDVIYMHSYPRGEKIENILKNNKVGFEVDRELEFLPSYFSHPTDASQADTLYISVVLKGTAYLVEDDAEKTLALNGLMEKYQPEGHYEPIKKDDLVLDEVAIIKVVSDSIKGKYKIGKSVQKCLQQEKEQKLDKLETYKEFFKRIEVRRDELQKLFKKLKDDKKIIAGFGAPAKATTSNANRSLNRKKNSRLIPHNLLFYMGFKTQINSYQFGTQVPKLLVIRT